MKFYIFLIATFFINFSFSQIIVQGKVESNGDTLLYYNVLVLNSSDSTFIKGDHFSGELFSISQINQNNFLVKITSLEFRDTIIPVYTTNNKEIVDLGLVSLYKENSLDEVIIQSKKPLFEKVNGSTIVNVDGTLLGLSTSFTELLGKTPNVKVSENQVDVFGKGKALVYLNGKQVPYERLSSLPVNQIKKIEIITNPSAKYDAEGKAVINVITKTNSAVGFNGQIIENFTQGIYAQSTSSLNLNYRTKKIYLYTDYSFNTGKDWNKGKTVTGISQGLEKYSNESNHEEHNRMTDISNGRFGVAYNLNDHSEVSVQYDGLYHKYDLKVSDISNIENESNGYLAKIIAENKGQTVNKNNSVSLNYSNDLDTLGSTFFLGGQYCDFTTNLYDQIHEQIFSGISILNEADRVNDGLSKIQLITGQVDYLKVFKNKSTLELGTKYSGVNNDGRVNFKSKQINSQQWIDYPQFSNSFLYLENVVALYTQYSKEITKKWHTSAGIRSEISKVDGFSRTYDKKVIDTTYINFFPTFKLSYAKSEQLSFDFNFSSRINRPFYQDIDPFVWYNDSLFSTQGNPLLKPEICYSTEFEIVYKDYSAKFGYMNSVNTMRLLPKTGNNGANSILLSTYNFKASQQLYCFLYVPFETKFINSYNTINGTYESLTSYEENVTNQKPTPQLYLYSYNQLSFVKFCKIDISGEYSSKYSDGLNSWKAKYTFGLGASKKFCNNKLSTSILVNDFLRTYREQRSSQIGIFQVDSDKKFNTFYVRFTISYKFGRLKDVKPTNKGINEDELNRIIY